MADEQPVQTEISHVEFGDSNRNRDGSYYSPAVTTPGVGGGTNDGRPPRHPLTTLGPLKSEQTRSSVENHVAESEISVICGNAEESLVDGAVGDGVL